MRLLFVADGRSPIAQNWIRYFIGGGDEVYLASTYPCSIDLPLKGLEITPVAFSARARAGKYLTNQSPLKSSTFLRPSVGLRTAIRDWLGPLTIPRASRRLRQTIARVRPDLVHAMRIPYEGMLAADSYGGAPLLVSVWGNDFTLHAPSNLLTRHYTSWTLEVADALHADSQRDIRLSRRWGFTAQKPTLVIPGNGGVKTDVFYPPSRPVEDPVVINPRGARAYVRNDVFFQAIPLVLARRPDARFICVSLANNPEAVNWVRTLHLGGAVELLPSVPHTDMAGLFRRAQLMVSPSVHDGTPNSLLEAMACGCLPVAGDLESVREWITHGHNGLLADANDPQALAGAILEGLANGNLRRRAAGFNQIMVMQRAEYVRCMGEAGKFYRSIIARS
jgi:glycosyltransferase involved in cell wall biosynthesis